MTKKEVEDLGRKEGRDRAESIYGDVPYERLATVLQKYRTKKAWLSLLEDPYGEIFQHRYKLSSAQMKDFARCFIAGGIKEINENIAYAIKTGYLKET